VSSQQADERPPPDPIGPSPPTPLPTRFHTAAKMADFSERGESAVRTAASSAVTEPRQKPPSPLPMCVCQVLSAGLNRDRQAPLDRAQALRLVSSSRSIGRFMASPFLRGPWVLGPPATFGAASSLATDGR
jgi:hypothetical protein